MATDGWLGLLNLHKPAGLSSRQVVNRVMRVVRPAKAGHAGTLDPLATGVLVVCVGSATRLISLVQELPKNYRGRFRLGATSPTDDVEGDVTPLPDAPRVTRADLERLLPGFTGTIDQVPPAYSAVHVEGERAYRLARRGEAVELQPRPVTIYRLALVEFADQHFTLEIECGSGTYVRSIGRDLGRALGSGAVMTELVRTAIGPFRLEEALDVDNLSPDLLRQHLVPPRLATTHLPQLMLTESQTADVRHGRRIPTDQTFSTKDSVALFTGNGDLLAIAEYRPDEQALAPRLVLPAD